MEIIGIDLPFLAPTGASNQLGHCELPSVGWMFDRRDSQPSLPSTHETVVGGFGHRLGWFVESAEAALVVELLDPAIINEFSDVVIPLKAPVTVTVLTGATAIEAGRIHTCAIATGATFKCCGTNSDGQLGDGTKEALAVPVLMVGL